MTIEAELAKGYALSDEDAQAIRSNPEEALPDLLPKLAARVHRSVQEQMAKGLAQGLPQYLQQHQQQQQQQAQAEEKFFSRWPKLKDKDPSQLVRLMQAHRQAYPDATVEERIEDVGSMAMVKLKIPFEDQPAAPVEESVPAATAPPPPATSGSRGPAPSNAQAATPNTFESLAESILDEEVG